MKCEECGVEYDLSTADDDKKHEPWACRLGVEVKRDDKKSTTSVARRELQSRFAREIESTHEDALRAIAPDAIHTEAQLARALFIAMNEAEVVRRCELREAGENVRNLLTERCRAVVTTMLADPAYAKERQAAERLASRTWSARRGRR